MEFILGLMEIYLKVFGLMTRGMEKENSDKLMRVFIKNYEIYFKLIIIYFNKHKNI